MTAREQAVNSGQVSAAQIEAHRAAGELPIVMFELRFQHTYCSQCGMDCGPGMEGFSSCGNHIADASKKVAKPQTLREMCDAAFGGWVNVPEADLRAALDDAERYRWLRDDDQFQPEGERELYVIQARLPFREDQSDQVLVMSDLDRAIDASIKGAQS